MVVKLISDEGIKIGCQNASEKVCCFSIEFPSDPAFNESDIAERTAKWLDVNILKKECDEVALAENFADCAYHTEHHNFDLNSVGTFLLSALPRENGFKVILNGEGSDEHFAGYPFLPMDYLREPDLSLPDHPLVKDPELRKTLQSAAEKDLRDIYARTGTSHPDRWDDCAAFRAVNNSRMPTSLPPWQPHVSIFAPWVRTEWAELDPRNTVVAYHSQDVLDKMQNKWHPLHTSEYLWTKSILANNLLTCLGDRTEMAHSMEARPPFLDHHLVEYVNGLPPSLKIAYDPENAPPERDQGPFWVGVGTAREVLSEKWIFREAASHLLRRSCTRERSILIWHR